MIASSAFEMGNRSSMVTPEIVAQMGFVPRGLYEKKLTVGQQRRPKAKKHAQHGGRGGKGQWSGAFKKHALEQYMKLIGLEPGDKTALQMANALSSSSTATVEDLQSKIDTGDVIGDRDVLYTARYLKSLAKEGPDAQRELFADPPVSTEEFMQSRQSLKTQLAQHSPVNAPEPVDRTQVKLDSDDAARANHTSEAAELQVVAQEIQKQVDALDEGIDEGFEDASADDQEDMVESAVHTLFLATEAVKEGAAPEKQLAADTVLQHELEHITESNSHPTAITTAEQLLEDMDSELVEKHAATLRQLEISSPATLKLTGTPSKVSTYKRQGRPEVVQTPGAAQLRDTPESQQNTPLMQLAPVVMDPAMLSSLGRIAAEVADSNQLLAEMSQDQVRAFAGLERKAQQLLITDKQVSADEVPVILDHLRAYPEIAQLMSQGLVKPEQLKDKEYVLSLKQSLAQSKMEGRSEDMGGRIRTSKAPVFKREVRSKRTPGLNYYRPPKYTAKSIFAQ